MKVRSELNSPSHKHRVIFTAAFSLLEVLVAMVVVGTSAVAMFSGINTGFFTMQLARENLRATQIMLQVTETLRLYNWDQIDPANFPVTFQEAYDPNSTNSGISYTTTVQVTPTSLGTSYSGNMRKVTVSLNWTTGGLARTRTNVTYVCRNGLQSYVY